jgi:phosphopantetheinyl transferase
MLNLDYFMRFWTLKESYIKGVGIGLGMELQDFFFRQKNVGNLPRMISDFDYNPEHSDAEVISYETLDSDQKV